ncbi:hypothetical protein C8R43DRAFT_1243739 [Mycena crocata]|nr:hypothetical protein C8R43DRAFT_1243739 [Mycena crocata]
MDSTQSASVPEDPIFGAAPSFNTAVEEMDSATILTTSPALCLTSLVYALVRRTFAAAVESTVEASMSTRTDMRINTIVARLTPMVPLLRELGDAFGTPFVPAITNTTVSLISILENVKKNKDDCVQLMEDVSQLLTAIVKLHINSMPSGDLPASSLYDVAKFTETLHKIHTFVEAQQEAPKLKHLFRNTEMKTLLSECRTGLHLSLEGFKTQMTGTVLGNAPQIQEEIERMHKQVLELISTLSDGPTSDSSSIHNWAKDFQNSSKSFSMLPAKPQIFHGRDSELSDIVDMLLHKSARIAILGGGGMGKTSLAKATLHHPEIVNNFQLRFFVVVESVTSDIDLAAAIGTHIGFKPENNLTTKVIQFLSRAGSSLLVLDSLDASWEPLESRNGVEELLSKLTQIEQLGLVITMRGSERPTKVRWSRPFFPALQPLSLSASQQTFIDIAEDFHDSKEVDELLALTDNMPLAVNLMAHAVEYEGSCFNVLARWQAERTSMLSAGYNRNSNLDASIRISLSSPRMSSGARDLLRLLSVLPDGISDTDLLQSKLPIDDISACKSVLLATALAHNDSTNRLKSLAPIREHLQHFNPVSPALLHSLLHYFHRLLDLHRTIWGTEEGVVPVSQMMTNVGNLQQLLLRGLHEADPYLLDTIQCALSLIGFTSHTGHGQHFNNLLMHRIQAVSPQISGSLQARFITEALGSRNVNYFADVNAMIAQAVVIFGTIRDSVLETRFFFTAGKYRFYYQKNFSGAMEYLQKALNLSRSSPGHGDAQRRQEALTLNYIAEIQWSTGNYSVAQLNAREAHRISQLTGNLHFQAQCLQTLAWCCRDLGDNRNSIVMLQRARKLLGLCGMDGTFLCQTLSQEEAESHLVQSEYAEARKIHAQLVADTANDSDAITHAWGLLNLAQIDILTGETSTDARETINKAKAIFESIGDPWMLIYCDITLADLILGDGATDSAKNIFEQCFKSAWGNDSQAALLCLERLGNTSHWAVSDHLWSSRLAVVYLGYASKLKNKLALHTALQFLADVFQTDDDADTSAALFTVALEGFTQMNVHRSRAECMVRLADLSEHRGQEMKAVELWQMARPLFERSLQTRKIALVDEKLAKTGDRRAESSLQWMSVPASDIRLAYT